MDLLGIYNYWIYIILMMVGFYGVIAKKNLLKQAISLSLFQTAIFLFYISMAVVDHGTAPIWVADGAHKIPDPAVNPTAFDNPLPHVLMLTAIVVGVSVLAVALAIIINIRRAYGTIEYDEIRRIEQQMGAEEAAAEVRARG
ncbi:MAG: cation:proton antiporter subunit C [Myxococcales bacterium]|nr:cation:proton antiporter subunit C [Myxococcales bacterium]